MTKPTGRKPTGRPPSDPARRFWQKVDKTATCWLWRGAIDVRHGYGYFTPEPRGSKPWPKMQAHRYAWMLERGPILDGLCVLHNCPNGDNRRCVNPTHLWLGTRPENQADMARKGRAANGSKTHPERLLRGDLSPSHLHPERLRRGSARSDARLDEARVMAIRQRYAAGGVSQSQLAHEFGVCQANIHRIIHRKMWTHI